MLITQLQNHVNNGLERQALKRPLTSAEQRLASVLEQIFRSGVTDFDEVASLLQQNDVQPPSGATVPWNSALLHSELNAINRSLDEAYSRGNTA